MQLWDLWGDVSIRGESQVNNTLNRIGDTFTKIGGKMQMFGSILSASVSLPILGLMGKSTMLASDLEESFNVVNVTFGKSAKEVTDWSKNLLNDFGLVQLESMKYVGSMGAMLKSSGLTAKASKEMSQDLVELTGDFSSFYNLSHDESWEKIRSGISGETEPLKQVGINMSVANMEAFALSQGIKKSWGEMTQAEQTMLRYNYLMEQTADAQGDFARTNDGLANRLRILQGNLTNLGTKLGNILLPIVNKFTGFMVDLTSKFSILPEPIQKVTIILGLLASAVGPLLLVGGLLITALGTIATAITAVGWPVIAVGAVVGVLSVEFAALIGFITIAAKKAGVLDKAISFLKDSFKAIVAFIKGDTSLVFDLLTEKFGYSYAEAAEFIKKAIILKEKIIDLGAKVKNFAQSQLNLFIEKIKKASEFVYDHRKQIGLVIESLINFGSKSIDIGVGVARTIKDMADKAKENFDTVITIIKKVVEWFIKLNDKVDGVVKGIGSIKFPNPPGWLGKIPGLASGSMNFGGGLTWVGETGPELVSLPRGSRIHTAAESKNIITGSKNISGNDTYNINVVLDAKNVKDFNRVVDFIYRIKEEAIAGGSY